MGRDAGCRRAGRGRRPAVAEFRVFFRIGRFDPLAARVEIAGRVPSRKRLTFSRLAAALSASVFCGAPTAPADAQPAANATLAHQVVSPAVAADHEVTDRRDAPNVNPGTLTGDFIANNPRRAQNETSGG